MANKNLFKSIFGKLLPKADARNEEGGLAYRFDAKHALAQYAATGCLNATFYASAEDQLAKVLELAGQVEPEFIARTALYARTEGFMKDLPALLTAVLSVRSPGLMAEIFDRVIDSPKMLRNFVQIIRSGVVGRKSLGTLPKRLILAWLAARTDEQLFTGSVGQDPSLADVIRMVHPKPANPAQEALFGYLVGRPHNAEVLPPLVRQFEAFRAAEQSHRPAVPDVPFQMLTALDLGRNEWTEIAKNAPWQMTRMNLNTFARHGVFEDSGVVKLVADRLANRELVKRAHVFPYQLMVAYMNASADLPGAIREALQDAMEIALENVPKVDEKVYVFPDVSGSMHSAITGHRKGATSAVRCVDIAALVAAAMLRKNPDTEVIPFESDIVKVKLNPRDSVMTNAAKLASLPAGGTNCSAPLRHLNRQRAAGDLVIYVSDNESWVDSPTHGRYNGSAPTETLRQWAQFKQRSPNARMVCIDIQPYDTTQAKERPDIINVAGFSDRVFELIGQVASGQAGQDHWVRVIEAMRL
jgi:60 kDa SS-A/Ro ribonucleoprotein